MALLSSLKITELESSNVVLGMFDRGAWELSPFAENAMSDANYDATAAYQTAIDAHEPCPPRSSLPDVDCWRLSKRELISEIRGGASRASLPPILDATAERVGSEAPMLRADLKKGGLTPRSRKKSRKCNPSHTYPPCVGFTQFTWVSPGRPPVRGALPYCLGNCHRSGVARRHRRNATTCPEALVAKRHGVVLQIVL